MYVQQIVLQFLRGGFTKMGEFAYNTTKERYTNYDLLFCIYDTGIAKVFNLKQSTLSTLACLCKYYNHSTGVVYPSVKTISNKINADPRTVSRALEELVNKGLILKIQKGSHNSYIFGNIFWQFIKTPAQKSNRITRPKAQKPLNNGKTTHAILSRLQIHAQNLKPEDKKIPAQKININSEIVTKNLTTKSNLVTCQKNKNTCHFDTQIHAKMSYEQNNHEQNNIYHHKQLLLKNKNNDVLNNNFVEYKKIILKLEKWSFTGAKFAIKKYGLQKLKNLIEVVENKNPHNKGAYLRALLNTPGNISTDYEKSSSRPSEQPLIKRMLKHQYWKHIPSGQTLKVKPDIGEHLLIRYYSAENLIEFFENGLTDSLFNFKPIF